MAGPMKRDRNQFQADYLDKEDSSRDVKKHVKSLPIRAPSLRLYPPAPSSSGRAFSKITSQTLTPVESSDDELLECEASRLSVSRTLERYGSQDSSGSSASSIRAQAGWDDDMEMGQSPPTEPAFISLAQVDSGQDLANSTFLQTPTFQKTQPQQRSGTNRVPTPIRPTFKNGSDIEMGDSTTASRFPTVPRTALSPTMREDTPPTDTGLPSPTSEYTSTAVHDQMEMSLSPEPSQPLFLHPNVVPFDTPRSRRSQARPSREAYENHGLDGQTEPQINAGASDPPISRTPRLHMGYRADCEKCVARVPGHYSHILWS